MLTTEKLKTAPDVETCCWIQTKMLRHAAGRLGSWYHIYIHTHRTHIYIYIPYKLYLPLYVKHPWTYQMLAAHGSPIPFSWILLVVCVAMLVSHFLRPRSVCARGCEIQGESPNRIHSNIAQLWILEVTLWNLKFKSLRLSDSHPLHTVCFSGIFTNGSWLWHLGLRAALAEHISINLTSDQLEHQV